jgi:alpha-methylacyl-CoA racemase
MKARGTFVELDGVTMPGPAPRFSRTPSQVQGPVPRAGQHTDDVLAQWGWTDGEISQLRQLGAVG